MRLFPYVRFLLILCLCSWIVRSSAQSNIKIANLTFTSIEVSGGATRAFKAIGGFNVGGGLLAVADLNRDGNADLIGGGGTGTLDVLLGNGNGTFQPRLRSSAGYITDVAVGDFDGDGNLDLAISNWFGDVIQVFLGNGDGTFRMGNSFTTGSSPVAVRTGDFNGDGKLDLANTNSGFGGNSVSVLLGNGDGTFQPEVEYPIGIQPEGLTIADLNNDGKLDLATANYGSDNGDTISVFLGNGDGTFQQQTQYRTGVAPCSILVGDFNADGNLDVATGNLGPFAAGTTVSVLLGNGDGSFQAPTNYTAGTQPQKIAVGDFNSDGKLDLVSANYQSQNVSVLLGNGDGTFRAHSDYRTGPSPASVLVADFNNDGAQDLAVGDNSIKGILLLNTRNHRAPPSSPIP